MSISLLPRRYFSHSFVKVKTINNIDEEYNNASIHEQSSQ